MSIIDKITSREESKPTTESFMYTEDQLMARLRFFIGICLALTLTGIVFVVLYSIIFVTQPLNAMSPIDQKFFELIIPIATFLTGTLSGIMLAGKDDKEIRARALEAATGNTPGAPRPAAPMAGIPGSPIGGMPSSFPRPAAPMAPPPPIMSGMPPPPPPGVAPVSSAPPGPPNLPPPPVF